RNVNYSHLQQNASASMPATYASTRQILAIEDDTVLSTHLKTSLEQQGFQVTVANDGNTGLSLAIQRTYDLILLDVLLPALDGLSLLARLRAERGTPVLMMSALNDETHRIQGFDAGADDYLPKPFSLDELKVRMYAILRRVAYERSQPQPASSGPLRFDDERCDLAFQGQWSGLTPTEYRVLHLLYNAA